MKRFIVTLIISSLVVGTFLFAVYIYKKEASRPTAEQYLEAREDLAKELRARMRESLKGMGSLAQEALEETK